jgi:cytochrome c peroxidase
MARLGRTIFFDARLSSSGRLSCASCHSPAHAYGPPGDGAVVFGGPHLTRPGVRAVPSLMYLERQPNFSIGPDNEETENVNPLQVATLAAGASHPRKTAGNNARSAANLVPQGGLFWDGRADTLQGQALIPLLNPLEMDGGSVARIAAKLRTARYARAFVQLFGAAVLQDARLLVAEATFAVGRYEFEESSFHPYTSKYDAWLEGKAQLSPAELRGKQLFDDPHGADCAACHVDKPAAGLPPLFTDHQFEALAVPRNPAIPANRDPHAFDLGICGPYRSDLKTAPQYCGMFLTPTLRNVATRRVFFHNGVYHTLQQVLDFYEFRATQPQKIYPRGSNGRVETYDDLPPAYRRNVDVTDPPFDRTRGEKPALTPQQERDVIAFLETLTDGYRPRP